MSVSRHDGSTVILGTEAGLIFQASLNSINEMEPDKLDLAGIAIDDGKWFDPVKSTFAGHTGRVLDIKVTKDLKNIRNIYQCFRNSSYNCNYFNNEILKIKISLINFFSSFLLFT
jgi:hypothetical protein